MTPPNGGTTRLWKDREPYTSYDVPGHVTLMDGPEKFNAKLDQHFGGGHNPQDNEASNHNGYLYDYSRERWKTRARVRQITGQYYSNQPDGIAGNEGCGQVSAWYVLTAMGFYPVNPASAEYIIGSPIFTKTTRRLPNGKTFVISAENDSPDNIYIQSAPLNAQSLDKPIFAYAQIEAGGSLGFIMGATPSTWASQWRPLPLAARR